MNMNRKASKISGKKKNPLIVLMQKNLALILTTALSFIVMGVIVFFGVSQNFTVAAFALNEYEVGQVADRTIIAERTLPSTMEYPVVVKEGEKVTRKGFPITEEAYRKLEKMANTREYLDYRFFANKLIYLALLVVLWYFFFSPLLIGHTVHLKEILTEVIFFILIYSATLFAGRLTIAANSPYMHCVFIPSAFFIFIVAILFGERSAVFFSIITILGVLNASDYNLNVFLFEAASCLASARITRNLKNRMNMVVVSLLLAVLNVVLMVILRVIFNEAFDGLGQAAVGLAGNGFLSGILVLGFITPLEIILNTASIFRLTDLSDLNNSPVMGKMLLTASGTYSHSLMVATLSENACLEIGANPLLARVGAYYHDIGKLEQSEYFVENSHGGSSHKDINPSLYTSIIRSHVKKGVEKARQMRLPQQVIDIIAEHHGNSVIAFFYNEAKKTDPNANIEDFRYNGNPPTSKESAVVMLADTAEAACRTLDDPSVPRIEKFLQGLFEAKLNNGQLDLCNLTFGELTKIKNCFVSILAGYYHSRIEYPDQKDPDDQTKEESKDEPKAKGSKTEKTSKASKSEKDK